MWPWNKHQFKVTKSRPIQGHALQKPTKMVTLKNLASFFLCLFSPNIIPQRLAIAWAGPRYQRVSQIIIPCVDVLCMTLPWYLTIIFSCGLPNDYPKIQKPGWCWLVGTSILHFPILIGFRLSSQLTHSYFSEGWPNHQPDNKKRTSKPNFDAILGSPCCALP